MRRSGRDKGLIVAIEAVGSLAALARELEAHRNQAAKLT
jgi:hypothetical protein